MQELDISKQDFSTPKSQDIAPSTPEKSEMGNVNKKVESAAIDEDPAPVSMESPLTAANVADATISESGLVPGSTADTSLLGATAPTPSTENVPDRAAIILDKELLSNVEGTSATTVQSTAAPLADDVTLLSAERGVAPAVKPDTSPTSDNVENVCSAKGTLPDAKKKDIRRADGSPAEENISTDVSMTKEGKKVVSAVVCGHVGSGKSTAMGRLIFELGGISEREMLKIKEESKTLSKESLQFSFFMDKLTEERTRGETIVCSTKDFSTDAYHYTVIDAPGHRNFIKNMIIGASQADIGILMVPADGAFAASIAEGDHKAGQTEGQARHHARLLNSLGMKQIIVCVNKMDGEMAQYGEERFNEIAKEVRRMLTSAGWRKRFVARSVPVIPISGLTGDNLTTKSESMEWWKGCSIFVSQETAHVHTLLGALKSVGKLPERVLTAGLRMPVSGIFKVEGTGDVVTGRIEQGTVKPNDLVKFLPPHRAATDCKGTVVSVQMHHKTVDIGIPGHIIGVNISGLESQSMPRVGDVMVLEQDQSLPLCESFTAQMQVLNPPGGLKQGYAPLAYIRTGRSPVKMMQINWKVSANTGRKKVNNPKSVSADEFAEIVFKPLTPIVLASFKDCEGLGRVIIMEGNSAVMVGKVSSVGFAK